jgi:hypothetical protein
MGEATSKSDVPSETRKSPLIRTTHVYPPIPIRQFDWQAWYDGEEDEQMDTGSGSTEENAIRDLIINHPRSGNPCTACGKPFFDGDTCSRGGCPCGGDF